MVSSVGRFMIKAGSHSSADSGRKSGIAKDGVSFNQSLTRIELTSETVISRYGNTGRLYYTDFIKPVQEQDTAKLIAVFLQPLHIFSHCFDLSLA